MSHCKLSFSCAMTAPSAHYSRGFSTFSQPNIRRMQFNGAAFDRYGIIRNFFRSQTVALQTLSHQNTIAPTNMCIFSRHEVGVCGKKPKGCSFSFWGGPTHTKSHRLNTRLFDKRPFPSVVGLNSQVRSARWIYASTACMGPAGAYKKPNTQPRNNVQLQRCTCTPPTSQLPHIQHTLHLDPNQRIDMNSADPPKHLEDYSRFFRRLALSLPHAHRPTREDLLNVATGFWQRLRIRFKWFTIKSFRKFNADDISAFVTWFLMSQTLWILVGTWVAEFMDLSHSFTCIQDNVFFCCLCHRK